MTKVFALFVGGPWDHVWDYVPLENYLEVYTSETTVGHTYILTMIPLNTLKTALYIYHSEDLSMEETMFRVITSYSETQEDEK